MQTKDVPYTFKRQGYFYFSRRVPSDLQQHYSYPRVVVGLRTKSKHRASQLANAAASDLERYWAQLRIARSEVLGKHLVRDPLAATQSGIQSEDLDCPTLTEGLEKYLSLKGADRTKTFEAAARRSCNYVIRLVGNKMLSQYTRLDALRLRDWMIEAGLAGSSITRNFGNIKAVFNFACSEWALECKNPFVGVFHDRTAGVVARRPIPVADIRSVQVCCMDLDDDIRWLVALVSDTGMRLAEAAGLSKADFKGLDTDLPHIQLVQHPWRQLKTTSSERLIPLTGCALWAAKRIVAADDNSQFAFPRYNNKRYTTANAASAALNKWLKPYVAVGCTMHSFRHSMRDRLRAVECPSEIADQLGGWSSSSVGQGYGDGYPLEVLHSWMTKATKK